MQESEELLLLESDGALLEPFVGETGLKSLLLLAFSFLEGDEAHIPSLHIPFFLAENEPHHFVKGLIFRVLLEIVREALLLNLHAILEVVLSWVQVLEDLVHCEEVGFYLCLQVPIHSSRVNGSQVALERGFACLEVLEI